MASKEVEDKKPVNKTEEPRKEVEDKKPDNETKKPPAKSAESKAFEKYEKEMKCMLESIITTFAAELWGRNVIATNVYEMIFDKECDGSCERSYFFLHRIYRKIEEIEKSEPQKAKTMIDTVADIIDHTDSALHNTAETISKFLHCNFYIVIWYNCIIMYIYMFCISGECENSEELREEITTISTILQSNLTSIAPAVYKKDIITEAEYDMIMDPAAKHSTRCTTKIFKDVRVLIKKDPTKMEAFISAIIAMGKPISDWALRLRKYFHFEV